MNAPGLALNVLISSDCEVIARALTSMFNDLDAKNKVLRTAINEATRFIEFFKPHIIIVKAEINMQIKLLINELRHLAPQAAFIAVVTADNLPKQIHAIEGEGCTCFLPSSFTIKELLTAVDCALGKQRYYGNSIAQQLAVHRGEKLSKVNDVKPQLTEMQQKVTNGIMANKTNAQMAKEYNRAISTIEGIRGGLYKKAGVKKLAGFVAWAISNGFYVDAV